MSKTTEKQNRKHQILQALTEMLADSSKKITTAKLAEHVGVTEAALYRHFPSKAKMYEGLMDFIEATIFPRIHQILSDDSAALEQKCIHSVSLLLNFAEKNPGMCRILTAEVFVGEKPRLRERVQQFFERFETEIRQAVRKAELEQGVKLVQTAGETANMMTILASGYLNQFSRSDFKYKILKHWEYQLQMLRIEA